MDMIEEVVDNGKTKYKVGEKIFDTKEKALEEIEKIKAAMLKRYGAEFGGSDSKDAVAGFLKQAGMKSSEQKVKQ